MRFREIQKSFEECGIFISDGGIVLCFPRYNPPEALSVSVCDNANNVELFRELTNLSKRVSVSLSPGFGVLFSFAFQIPIDKTIFLPPLKTPEDRRIDLARIANDRTHVDDEFMKLINSVSTLDEEDVKYAVLEFLESKKSDEVTVLPDVIHGLNEWKEFRESADGFLKEGSFGIVSVEEPEFDMPFGTIEFHMESSSQKTFAAENTFEFSKMIHHASTISMDAYTDNDVSMLTLTVFS